MYSSFYWSQTQEDQALLLLASIFLHMPLICWRALHKSLTHTGGVFLSVHLVSAYAIPLNPSMLFIFSCVWETEVSIPMAWYVWKRFPHFGTVRLSFPMPSWHQTLGCNMQRPSVAFAPARWWLGSCGVPNNTGLVDCGIKKWHRSI